MMDKSFVYRLNQLKFGKIEVPVAGTVPDAAEIIPDDILVDPEDISDPGQFRALVGWEDGNHA